MKLFLQLLTFDDTSNSHIQDTTGSDHGQAGGTCTGSRCKQPHQNAGCWRIGAFMATAKQKPSFQQQSVGHGSCSQAMGRFLIALGARKSCGLLMSCPLTDTSRPQGTVSQRLCFTLPFLCIVFTCPFPHNPLLPVLYCCHSSFLFQQQCGLFYFVPVPSLPLGTTPK